MQENSGSAVEIRLIGNELETDLVKKFLLKVLPRPIDTGDRKEREGEKWRRYLVLPDDNVGEMLKQESEEIESNAND